MTHNPTRIIRFRAAYRRATAAGYSGTKAEFADLIEAVPSLWRVQVADDAVAWLDYMEPKERYARKHDATLYVPNPLGAGA